MSDNTTLPGTGDVIASDDIGGVKYQRVKLTHGGDGEAVDASESNPVPVQDSDGNGILGRILQMLLSPLGYDKSLQRQRGTVVVETLPTLGNVTTVSSVTSVGSVTTVGTLTSQTNIGGFNADAQVRANINAAWNLNVRARIT
jgi:hypothetical protein